jgi:ABC-type lipoprotein export system ATPase subunit
LNFFEGHSPETPISVYGRISYIDKPQVGLNLTLERYLNPFNLEIAKNRFSDYFEQFNLPNYNLDSKMNSINPSAGQLQRLLFIRSILWNPNLLLVDEGMNFLDDESRQKIIQFLINNKSNMTTIFISHEDSLLNICDHIFECKNQSIVEMKK